MKLTKKCFIALASFVVLTLQAFGLKFDAPIVNEFIATGASILVMLGILSDSAPKRSESDENNDQVSDGELPPESESQTPTESDVTDTDVTESDVDETDE